MPKPKYKHIDLKDKADETALQIRNGLERLKEILNLKTQEDLLTGSDQDPKKWYRSVASRSIIFKRETKAIIKDQISKIKEDLRSRSKDMMISNARIKDLEKEITFKANTLGNVFIAQRGKWMTDIKIRSSGDTIQKVNSLYNEIVKATSQPIPINQMTHIMRDRNGDIRYKRDGSPMRETYEAYIERKVRTDIHSEIAHNVIKGGRSVGNVLYICSYFGDSRKEHADLQGKIYIDEAWESIVDSYDREDKEDLKEQIRSYISDHKILTIQEVQDEDTYGLGTWCNCRHTFEMIDIESVLDIKTDDDLNKVREDRKMNWNGEYEEAKNKALNKQRYYERGIKAWKEKYDEAKLRYDKLPPDASDEDKSKALKDLSFAKSKVKAWQSNQRDHIKAHSNLQRDYKRERVGDIYNLGVKK